MENFIESLNMTEGTIGAAMLKCNLVLKQHKRVAVSISGGEKRGTEKRYKSNIL